MRLSDDRSLARGRGKGTVSQNMHDVQVKQIMIAAGETTEKVCMVTPRTRHLEEIALQGSYAPSYSLHG